MMTERLLHYIWQFQYYNVNELATTNGESIRIIEPGMYNRNQGPDFLHARVRMCGRLWIGNIELHINTSDWFRHLHDEDPNYNNVILHVVWKDDVQEQLPEIPTVVLENRVPGLLLQQYENWLRKEHFIPCENSIRYTGELVWTSWNERLLIERLQRKSQHVFEQLRKNKNHWGETFWWMIARSFGLTINADAFEEMATSLPLGILMRHQRQIHQLEAMLFGQAGLLKQQLHEKYPDMLRKEYRFLKGKYGFNEIHLRMQFLRMRPASFPTVRIAQLSMLLHHVGHVFAHIAEIDKIDDIKRLLDVTANDYWHYHFMFDQESGYQPKKLGTQIIDSIMINCIIPYVYAYGVFRNSEKHTSKAIDWLRKMRPEHNTIINQFARIGICASDSAASQVLLELKGQYCDKRRCLDCSVGVALLKQHI